MSACITIGQHIFEEIKFQGLPESCFKMELFVDKFSRIKSRLITSKVLQKVSRINIFEAG